MQKALHHEFEKTATFFHPSEAKPSRYIKSSVKLFDFQLKVQGTSIPTKSNPSTSDTNNRQQTASTIQTEQSTPPQKKPILMRKGSQLQVRSDDKVMTNRIQSSNVYNKGSYEFQFRGGDCREVSFGEQESSNLQQFRRSGRRFIIKATQHFEETEQIQTPPSNKIPKPRNSPQSAGLKNKLPEIFQTSQRHTVMSQEKSMAQSKRTINGFRVQSQQQQRVPDNEFMLPIPPPELSRVQSTYETTLLPRIESAIVTKSRPFLQRKPQAKIIDRIFSGKSQN